MNLTFETCQNRRFKSSNSNKLTQSCAILSSLKQTRLDWQAGLFISISVLPTMTPDRTMLS